MSRLLTAEEAVEFRALLADYKLREDGLELFRASNFGVIAGPAGAGKDTLRNELVSNYANQYVPILSTTTRPPRPGEIDGITYHFLEVEDVKEKLRKHEFFQAELVHEQQISCLDMAEIRNLKKSQYGLSILITATEKKLRAYKSDIKAVFLVPPSLEILTKRMQAERSLNAAEIERRLNAAKAELSFAMDSDDYYCILSDSIPEMVDTAHKYFQESTFDTQADKDARLLMRNILGAIESN